MNAYRLKDNPKKPLLVIDDSPEDCESIRRTLRVVGIRNPVYYFSTGERALSYLMRQGCYADPASSPRPAMVLLDLNMPGTDGYELLRQIKSHTLLRAIPVVILTSSGNPDDIEKCYRRGANSYVLKYVDIELFEHAFQALKAFWFDQVLLPDLPEESG